MGADSRGPKGGSSNPFRTTERSQEGKLGWRTGLKRLTPCIKEDTKRCLPSGISSESLRAAIAVTYTLRVVAAASAENLSCRNSSTEPTGQLTGSTAWTKHQDSKMFHLESFLVERALALLMVSRTTSERSKAMIGHTHNFQISRCGCQILPWSWHGRCLLTGISHGSPSIRELSGRRCRIQMRLQRRFIWIANNRQVKSASSGSQNPLPRR